MSPPDSAARHIGIAADHGGYELKEYLLKMLRADAHEVTDFGDRTPEPTDDYPDFVAPLARAVASGKVFRGVAMRKRSWRDGRGKQNSGGAGMPDLRYLFSTPRGRGR